MNIPQKCSFDTDASLEMRRRWREFLDTFLPEFVKAEKLDTVIDVACGIGQFSDYLASLGLMTTGVDIRPSNIVEAGKRYPGIEFHTYNLEDPAILNLGSFDLVFCFGTLYHLENPFQAIRNLYSLTRKYLFIETRVIPLNSPVAALKEEGTGDDQSPNRTILIPSGVCLIKMLYTAGFTKVYKSTTLPIIADIPASEQTPPLVLFAPKVEFKMPNFRLVSEPRIFYNTDLRGGTRSVFPQPKNMILKIGSRLLHKMRGKCDWQ